MRHESIEESVCSMFVIHTAESREQK